MDIKCAVGSHHYRSSMRWNGKKWINNNVNISKSNICIIISISCVLLTHKVWQSLTDSGDLEVKVVFKPCPVQKVVARRACACVCIVCVCVCCTTSRCSPGGAEWHLALMGSLDQAGPAAPAPEWITRWLFLKCFQQQPLLWNSEVFEL